MKSLIAVTLLLLSQAVYASWTPLFNGKDLTGWKVAGGDGKFEVKNGEIHGISVANTGNTFLYTEKQYGDFILEAEFQIEAGINSGIQFRSALTPQGTVYGYQMEIDHSARAWSGGIYEEGKRGWLYPLDLHEAAKKAYRPNQWNKYRIACIGNHIRTWVNGREVASLQDDARAAGFIALQVHSLYKPEDVGKRNRWRNIRIQTPPLPLLPTPTIYTVNLLPNQLSNTEKAVGWQLLWDGKSTTGWRGVRQATFPAHGWQISDNNLIAVPLPHTTKGADLLSTQSFGPAFELRFEFYYEAGANSGVKYFVDEALSSDSLSAIGLEYQLVDDANHPDAKLGVVGNRTMASLYDLIPSKKFSWIAGKPNQWNLARIVSYPDGKVEHWLNNAVVLTYQRGGEIYDVLVARSKYATYPHFGLSKSGFVALQHHNEPIKFRSIRIRNL